MKIVDWKNVCKKICDITSTVFVLGLSYGIMFSSPRKKVQATNDYNYLIASYSKAVKAIVESNMLDSRKCEAIELLKRDGDDDYYKAVISVINSNMLDSRKVDTIRTISEDS